MPEYLQWSLAIFMAAGSVWIFRDGLRRRAMGSTPGEWLFARIVVGCVLVVMFGLELLGWVEPEARIGYNSPSETALHVASLLFYLSTGFLVFRAPKPPLKKPGPPKPIPRDLF